MKLPWWLWPWREALRQREDARRWMNNSLANDDRRRAEKARADALAEELAEQRRAYNRINAIRVFRKTFMRQLAADLRSGHPGYREIAVRIEAHLDTPTWEIPNTGDLKPEGMGL